MSRILGGLVVIGTAIANKTVITETGRLASVPLVKESYGCQEYCFFKDEVENGKHNAWCLQGNPPMLRAGWEIAQEFGESTSTCIGIECFSATKYYQIEFTPYLDTQALWSSVLEIQKLIEWDLTMFAPKFKTLLFFSLIINGNAEYCLGYGYEVDAIEISLQTSFRMSDCYKAVVRDLCDFSDTWTGYESKWLDDCNLSDEIVVDINKWDVLDEIQDEMFAGTTNPISVTYCLPLPFTTAFAELIE